MLDRVIAWTWTAPGQMVVGKLVGRGMVPVNRADIDAGAYGVVLELESGVTRLIALPSRYRDDAIRFRLLKPVAIKWRGGDTFDMIGDE